MQLLLQQILNLLITWFNFLKAGTRWAANNDIRPYAANVVVNSKGCNGIHFYNQGDVSVFINDSILVQPGLEYSIAQLDPRIQDNTVYKLRFDAKATGSTGNNNNLIVTVTQLTQLP